jgi:16S rRNA G527 N7-methylase RsmG
VKQLLDVYLSSLDSWNRIHHIIGNTPPGTLFKQSVTAIENSELVKLNDILIDVGAGSGILGFAYLFKDNSRCVVFVEPRIKSRAFLYEVKSKLPPEMSKRVIISESRIQDVSRETRDSWVQKSSNKNIVLASRAFSGDISLRDAVKLSVFKADPLYIFSENVAPGKQTTYCLNRLT